MAKTIVLAGGSADLGETRFAREARAFGRGVAGEGWRLRTGGGAGRSMMGAAADGALAAGGRVEGVILRKFWAARHRAVRPMRPYATFALRKAALFRGGHAAAIFPGGFGTLDELGDLLTLKQTGFIRMPIVVVNLSRYFDGLLRWVERADREGFLYGGGLFEAADSGADAVRRLRRALS